MQKELQEKLQKKIKSIYETKKEQSILKASMNHQSFS